MNVAESTHIPGKYTTALKGYDDVIEFYKGIPKAVIEQLYRIYYRQGDEVEMFVDRILVTSYFSVTKSTIFTPSLSMKSPTIQFTKIESGRRCHFRKSFSSIKKNFTKTSATNHSTLITNLYLNNNNNNFNTPINYTQLE